MIMSKYHFQIFFQANFNISALFVISFLSQENVEAFNESIPLGLNWIATVTHQHLVAALMNKNNRPSSSALFKNALIGNTFCIPHVHAFSANLCLILIENFSPRVLPWTKGVTDGSTPLEDLIHEGFLRWCLKEEKCPCPLNHSGFLKRNLCPLDIFFLTKNRERGERERKRKGKKERERKRKERRKEGRESKNQRGRRKREEEKFLKPIMNL